MEFELSTEWITLGQLLKAVGWVDLGSDAKPIIAEGRVKVNGEVETRRGRKLFDGDRVELSGQTVNVRSGGTARF